MIKYSLYIIIIIAIFSCEQIFEEDIENDEIYLIIPADGIRSSNQSIGFLWESNDQNTHYRLQIVQPDFNMPETLILDTLIEGTSFKQFLDIGKYEWRVRGENSAFQSAFSTNSLWVDTLNSSRLNK